MFFAVQAHKEVPSLSLALTLLLAQEAFGRTLVMPFDYLSPQQVHDWIGEAFAEATAANLSAAGRDIVGVADRNERLLEMGLPLGAPLTRATVILVGQGLGATRVVVGSFQVEEERISVSARIIDLEKGSMVGVVQDEGAVSDLLELQNQLSKNILRLEGAPVPDSFEKNAARRKTIPLEAYASYVKALLGESAEAQQKLLESALGRHPDYSEARLLLGQVLLGAGEARQAIEVLSSIRPELPLYREAYFTAGLAYLAAGDARGASEIFSNLAEREGAASFFNNLGVAWLRAGDLPKALQAFESAVERQPLAADLLFNLGWCAWRAGKGSEALKWLREAVRRDPADGEAHFLLSAAAASQALKEESEAERKLALELASRFESLDPSTIEGLERILDRLPPTAPGPGEEPDSGRSLSELVSYQIERARSLRASGKLEEAIRELQRAVYLSPYSAEARLELAGLYRESGQLAKAAGEAKIVLWSAESGQAHLALAEIYEVMGEIDQARFHAEKAEALEPGNLTVAKVIERLKNVRP